MRSPEPTPTSPVSVVTRTMVASKWVRGFVSQLALNGGSSGRRWWLIAMPAILCPEGAGRGLEGWAFMVRVDSLGAAFHSRRGRQSREFHYRYLEKASSPMEPCARSSHSGNLDDHLRSLS